MTARRLALVVAVVLPQCAQAADAQWRVSGETARACTIAFNCGGNDRCNQLRLDNRVTPQDIAQVSTNCNFTGGNAALEITSLNNGALRAVQDSEPLGYTLSLVGTGSDFSDRLLNVPLRVRFFPRNAGQTVTGLLRVRLENRQASLVAGRYTDRITITLIPEQ